MPSGAETATLDGPHPIDHNAIRPASEGAGLIVCCLRCYFFSVLAALTSGALVAAAVSVT
jgi:hypothetical protein